MSGEPPSRIDDTFEVRRLLRQLGDSSVPSPAGAAELAREARIAAGLDSELARLAKQRARARAWGAAGLAVAASAVLGLQIHGRSPSDAPLGITQEPTGAPPVARGDAERSAPSSLPSIAPPNPSKKRALGAGRTPSAAASAFGAAEPEPKSSLAEENRIFTAAVEAGRQGNVDEALRLLDDLLRQYPHSPLAQTAAVRKFRLLEKAGRLDEARRDAERYLTTYPTGFAVEEARRLERAAPAEPTNPTVAEP